VTIHRIVPNLKVEDTQAGHDFYVDFLGLQKAFDLGWIVNFRSAENRSVQVSLVSADATAVEDSSISVDVSDIDHVYAEAVRRGYEIVHPLTAEAWGVRRFFVRDPNGVVVNVVTHPDE
jgi:catechol 2,3-dioxygenase-like lactoylglutathione lyase family enzyme